MKKFLSCCLVAVMLVSAFAVGASALSWSAGAGFHAFEGESYSNKTDIGVAPIEFTDNGNSVDVKQGGYYDGANIDAGVRTNQKVGLDGLEVSVYFTKAPVATQDCWFAIHLMQKPELFNTGKMAENSGYVNLIRFGDPKLEMYHQNAWSQYGSTEIGANDDMFAVKTGDTITMSVDYKYGQYIVSYDHNGKVYELPAENTIQLSEEVFADDGMAYVVVTGSLLGADNDWEYTVTVKEGEGISEEKKATAAFGKAQKVALDEITGYVSQIEQFAAIANSAVEGKDYSADETITASFAVFETAKAAIEEAKAAVDAATDDAGLAAAKDAAGAALASARSAAEAIEASAQFLDNGDAGDEPNTDVVIPEDEAEDFNFLGLTGAAAIVVLILVILVVVAIVAVVVIVLLKKKKN